MHIDDLTGETWRFDATVHPHPHQTSPTITRGRAYRLPSDWTTDAWRNYWDGDEQVAFTVTYRNGPVPYPVTENEDTNRAMRAFRYSWEYGQGRDENIDNALASVARRITEYNPGSTFIVVNLDRGLDLYALAWGGDEDNTWRDEIESVWNGDIWRIEVQEYQPGFGIDGGDWVPTDEVPEEFYGEQITAGFEREFPLADFPADLLVGSDN